MVEKELRQGVTNVFDFSKSELSDELAFYPIQTISAIDKNLDEVLESKFCPAEILIYCSNFQTESKNLIHGYACWLSVSTQNAPLIAISSSYSHEVWCNHSSAVVRVFQPVR